MPRLIAASFFLAVAAIGFNAAAADGPQVPPGVTTKPSGAGVLLADAKGMALYTYAQDSRPGKSTCIDACAKVWPPLLAENEMPKKGDWSTIVRDDETHQWAFRGKPLYTYSKDNYPGIALGDRVGNAWRIALDPVVLPSSMVIRSIFLGRILTDIHGMTLYTRSDEEKGRSACEAKCLETWIPLPAPLLANDIGASTALPRSDGTRQWAYQGKRLYLNANDLKPGDTLGQGVEKLWQVAVLEAAAPLPPWVTVQRSDMGEVYADSKGLTLYTFAGSLEKTKLTVCDDACINKNWRAIPAEADSNSNGEWTTVAAEGGGLRWAYKGNPVYAHTRDTEPGAVGGDKWAAGAGGGGGGFNPIQRRRDYEE